MTQHFIRTALVIALLAGGARNSAATTLLVTDLGDTGAPGQLRTSINAAVSGDTIILPAGTILLSGGAGEDANVTGDLDIHKTLTILGAGPALTTIQIARADRVLDVHADGNLTLSGVTLSDGWVDPATAGGGAIRNGGQLRLMLSVVQNSFSGGGGGIMNSDRAYLGVQSTTVRGNVSTGVSGAGGGILNFGTADVTDSTITGNKASGTSSSNNGGGFENIGVAALTNVTISGNTTSGRGGGLFQGFAASKLTLRNVTVANNAANIGGGVQNMSPTAPPDLVNTIVAANTAGSSTDCDGTIISSGYNLVQSTAGCTVAGDPTGNILGVNAHLLALADNGGPTWTMGFKKASPALDAGWNAACPAADQRGVARPQDGGGGPVCDIGAFERSPSDR